MLFRTIGILFLVGGIAALFWTKPDTALTENQIAEANIARMEASLPKSVVSAKKKPKPPSFMKAYKEKQKEHIRYLVIFFIISGIVFLAYSFIKKRE
ncbi:hypothetical protein [Sulfurimonas sp. HSL-1716]|uniref:hypothetical protein n=1 Tax=Hydrocurvibacter sulfurireducens TaxID=3131937 RepID=UPI0031F9F50F